jgi:hypothetical protein
MQPRLQSIHTAVDQICCANIARPTCTEQNAAVKYHVAIPTSQLAPQQLRICRLGTITTSLSLQKQNCATNHCTPYTREKHEAHARHMQKPRAHNGITRLRYTLTKDAAQLCLLPNQYSAQTTAPIPVVMLCDHQNDMIHSLCTTCKQSSLVC